MNSEKRMNNCETEKNYICHSERAVATEESISSVIPAKAEKTGKHVRLLFPGGSNEAKSLVFGFINTVTMECLDLNQFQRTMSVAYPLWSVSEERGRN